MDRRIFCIFLLAAVALPAGAADGDKLFFSRSFPASIPPYFDVTVHSDGKVIYREALDDELPIEFEAPAEDISRLFEISESLGYFASPLSTPKRKTAFTGDKILRFTTASGEESEVRFVFSDEELAQELVTWFIHVADTEWHFINLERAIQFDRLGVNKAVLQFHAAFNEGRIIAPNQFLPVLGKISKDLKIVHLARSRAAGIVEQIEAAAAANE